MQFTNKFFQPCWAIATAQAIEGSHPCWLPLVECPACGFELSASGLVYPWICEERLFEPKQFERLRKGRLVKDATWDEILTCAEALRRDLTLPEPLADPLGTGSGACQSHHQWDLSGAPDVLEKAGSEESRICSGVDLCDVAALAKWASECRAWATETWIAEEPEQRELWLESLPVAVVGNGDDLALRGGEAPPCRCFISRTRMPARLSLPPSRASFKSGRNSVMYVGPGLWNLHTFTDPASGCFAAGTPGAKALPQLFALSS